jgi:hypothetical protein
MSLRMVVSKLIGPARLGALGGLGANVADGCREKVGNFTSEVSASIVIVEQGVTPAYTRQRVPAVGRPANGHGPDAPRFLPVRAQRDPFRGRAEGGALREELLVLHDDHGRRTPSQFPSLCSHDIMPLRHNEGGAR